MSSPDLRERDADFDRVLGAELAALRPAVPRGFVVRVSAAIERDQRARRRRRTATYAATGFALAAAALMIVRSAAPAPPPAVSPWTRAPLDAVAASSLETWFARLDGETVITAPWVTVTGLDPFTHAELAIVVTRPERERRGPSETDTNPATDDPIASQEEPVFIKASLALVATAGAVLTVHVVRGRAAVHPTDRPGFVLAAGDHAAIPVAGAATITPDTQLAVARTAPPPVHAAVSEPVAAEVNADECPANGGPKPDGECDCAEGKCDGPSGKAPDQPTHVVLDLDGAPAMGPRDAKVTIVEIVDFQCPFCEKAVATVHDLAALYPDDVRVVIKHLPLPGHKQARPAAIASMAADRQGKFWEMHEMLFSNQEKLDRASMVGYAKHLGLDVARFEADLDNPAIAEAIDADASEAVAKGFRGVPAFAINGRVVLGALPLDDLRAVVEEELAKVRGQKQ